jgi:hypothetical protein
MPECHTCDLVINRDCFTCAVCGAVGAASYATLFTLSSGVHRFLGLVSLVFEQNCAHSANLLLIIGMLLFCTIADKICSRSQVVRQLGGMSAKRFSAQTCPKHLLGVRLFFQTQL